MEPIVISIDHGNKHIKLDSLNKELYPHGIVFNAGCESSLTKPGMGEVLKYKERFHTLSSSRFEYQRDKTVDERYFILTLFAIGMELEGLGYSPNNAEPYPIVLLTCLPPGHLGSLRERFARYFAKGGQTILFSYKGNPYRIQISDVPVYPQGYAAAVTKMEEIRQYTRAVIVEMGGYTTELIQMIDGKPDSSMIRSIETGTIPFYDMTIDTINKEFGLRLSETDIDATLLGKKSVLSASVKGRIGELGRNFTKNTFNKIREIGIDLKAAVPVIAGGGFLLFRKYLNEADIAQPIYIDSIAANGEGCRKLYEIQRKHSSRKE